MDICAGSVVMVSATVVLEEWHAVVCIRLASVRRVDQLISADGAVVADDQLYDRSTFADHRSPIS